MMRVLSFAFLLLAASAASAAHVRYCNGDLVIIEMTELTGKWPHKRSELAANLRVPLRPDRRPEKIIVEQSSGSPEVDTALIKVFSGWKFSKATNCDVILIPVKVTMNRGKT